MYDVLLVDDEPFNVEVLSTIVDWNALGFNIVAYASNGATALDYIEGHRIDVLITDIKMPVMDGLDLLRRIAEMDGNDMFCIVLSAYDELALVKESFKLGAFDYILKTEMERESIVEVLQKLTEHIEETRRKREETAKVLRDRARVARERFLIETLLNGVDAQDYVDEDFHDLPFLSNDMDISLICVKVGMPRDLEESVSPSHDPGPPIQDVFAEAREIGLEHDLDDVFPVSRNEFLGIVASADDVHREREARSFFSHCKASSKEKWGVQISGGISNGYGTYRMMPALYRKAETACDFAFFNDLHVPVAYDDMRNYRLAWPQDFVAGKVEMLREALHRGRPEDLWSFHGKVSLRKTKVPSAHIDEVIRLYREFELVIRDFVSSRDAYCELKPYLDALRDSHDDSLSAAFLDDWLRTLLGKMCGYLKCRNSLAMQARMFIDRNYSNDVSLKTVARHLQISREYLSKIFKEEYRETFSQYVNEVRIEHARDLMRTGNRKIYDIAETTGFASAEHFSRTFKRLVGLSPKSHMKNVGMK